MATKKSIWEELFGKENGLFISELVDPESLSGMERCYMMDNIHRDYCFYKDQKYDTYVIQLYEDTLSYLVKEYGH